MSRKCKRITSVFLNKIYQQQLTLTVCSLMFLVIFVFLFVLFHQHVKPGALDTLITRAQEKPSVNKVVAGTGDVPFGTYMTQTATTYHGHDLLNDPPMKFDSIFKNPCWFEEKQLRCLPYMFLIGVKKCGTGDLFKRIAMHPDFVTPEFKEAQWFARKRFSDSSSDHLNVYINMFSEVSKHILEGLSLKKGLFYFGKITGEGSPSNLHLNSHWQYLPGNENMDEPKYVILDYISHFLPSAKIIVVFRDPVERLYSDYYHEYGTLIRGNPTIAHFHEVVTKGLQAYNECFQNHTVRSCAYNSAIYNETRIQIQLGIYYIFWQELLRTFPRQQILVLQNNKLHDMETTLKSVYKFLDLRELSNKEMKEVVNAKRRKSYPREGPMFNKTLQLLQYFYAPFNKRMAEITDDSDFLYGYE